ncbi:MAG TPA: CoA-acylating methylmalonate-semialdehyde dehydrogenase [Thermoanaerobaculia bacterium]|nr:CoA-acylating methylmalonate-semialdehyde dehydrogenase [Thermoanaerobaculia bacterium]
MTVTEPTVASLSHWIDGAPSPSLSERTGAVHDPASGETIARVPFATDAEVDAAVAAARRALPAWRGMPAARRAGLLLAVRERVRAAGDELAAAVSREHGKTRVDAAGEVQRGLEVIDFACSAPLLLKGEFSARVAGGIDVYTVREAVGVVAGITPFNFPLMVPLWMIPIALACGNTFVLKPSEKDPSAANLLAELFTVAGVPDGVINVVHGDRTAVERLLRHPDVAAVSFVGSTPVARSIYETGTRHGKRVQALGGAKNHMVVLPDADLENAADAAVSAGYGSAGERCMAVSVVVAVGDVGDRLVPAIAERIDRLRVGPASDPESEMGPLITGDHRDRVAGYVDRGAEAGAELVRDGRGMTVGGCAGGYFLGPTLFDRVEPGMELYRDEIFGPVLSVVRVATFAEAVALVNSNPWANGVAVFTEDGGAARRFESEAEIGMVGINVPIPVPVGYHSFGGWRQSLFGSHGIYGPEGVHFYTRQKVVTRRFGDPETRGVDLGFPRSR